MPTPHTEYVYLIGSHKFCWYKIGKSTNAVMRVKTLGVLLPFKIELIALWSTNNCGCLEEYLHEQFRKNRINGEWFFFDRFELPDVVGGSWPWGAKLVTDHGLVGFTNLEEDKKISKYGPYKELRTKIAVHSVAEWLFKNGKENTPENRAEASKATAGDQKTQSTLCTLQTHIQKRE